MPKKERAFVFETFEGKEQGFGWEIVLGNWGGGCGNRTYLLNMLRKGMVGMSKLQMLLKLQL